MAIAEHVRFVGELEYDLLGRATGTPDYELPWYWLLDWIGVARHGAWRGYS